MMGCSPGDQECADEGNKPRDVTLTTSFWMAQTETTQGQYKKFRPEDIKIQDKLDDNLPMIFVNWSTALAACRSFGGDLPTEAQWEYAARGGSTAPRYGDIQDVAWHQGNSRNIAHEVMKKSPNKYGLYDMLGNVSEWTKDWYDPDFPARPEAKVDPYNGETAIRTDYGRVARGGSYSSIPRYTKSSNRHRLDPEDARGNVGFRCIRLCRP
jgi:formylglycine-generating enzyme required for sulfatase activity